MNRVAAVIVCYYPDEAKLTRLILAIHESVDLIVMIDNGGVDARGPRALSDKIRVESRGGINLGVASALNLGCDIATNQGCRYAISFDQDSHPGREMIHVLLAELQEFQSRGHKVAAIGPQLKDERGDSPHMMGFVRFTRFGFNTWRGAGTEPVDMLITSGCLMDLSAWQDDGRFNDALFIDFVDHNWCWRLARRSYLFLGTGRTIMSHELSNGVKKTSRGSLNTYSPVRRFYQCRNAVYHLLHEPLNYPQRRFTVRILYFTVLSALYSDPQTLQSLRACLRGFVHGMLKKLGPSGSE